MYGVYILKLKYINNLGTALVAVPYVIEDAISYRLVIDLLTKHACSMRTLNEHEMQDKETNAARSIVYFKSLKSCVAA